MKLRYLLLLLVFTSVNAQSYQPSIEVFERFDDVKLVAYINTSDIENYPLWHSLSEAPPLSIANAIQAVNELYKANNESIPAGTIKEIELREIPQHEKYWHYLIKIKVNNSEKPKYQVYVVLMNGKVIPAMLQPESYK